MTAPLKTVEGSGDIAATMRDIGRRAKAAARVLALASTDAEGPRARRAWRRRSAPAKSEILAANAEDLADGKAAGLTAAVARPADAERPARRGDGRRPRRGARARRSGRPGHRILDAAERHDHRARAGAARRRRRDLREPAERHRRRRRADAQGRQRRDPARRLGQPSLVARDPRRAGQGLARSQPAGGRDLARADPRPRRGRHDARKASTATSTSSCRAAARAWSRACRARRACRCSRISKASATSMSTRPPRSTWPRPS